MNIKKISLLFTALLFCFACSSEEKAAVSKNGDTPQKPKKTPTVRSSTKRAPYDQPDTHKEPRPVIPDVGAVDILDWEVKSSHDAKARIEDCKGYQALHAKDPEKISVVLHKEITPTFPYWVFAIQEKTEEKTTVLNYCTFLAKTTEIQCDHVGEAVCP